MLGTAGAVVGDPDAASTAADDTDGNVEVDDDGNVVGDDDAVPATTATDVLDPDTSGDAAALTLTVDDTTPTHTPYSD